MAPRLRIDDGYFPLITVAFWPGGCSDEDIEHMIAGFERVQARDQKYVALIDGAGMAAVPDARQRKRASDWEESHAAILRRLNVGTALVLDSAIARGAMTAVRWVSKPTTNERVFAHAFEAGKWCLTQLAAAHVSIPPSTRDFVASLEQRGSAALRAPAAGDRTRGIVETHRRRRPFAS